MRQYRHIVVLLLATVDPGRACLRAARSMGNHALALCQTSTERPVAGVELREGGDRVAGGWRACRRSCPIRWPASAEVAIARRRGSGGAARP